MAETPHVLKADSTFLLLGKLPPTQAGFETCREDAARARGWVSPGAAGPITALPRRGKRSRLPAGDSGETLGLPRFCKSLASPGAGRGRTDCAPAAAHLPGQAPPTGLHPVPCRSLSTPPLASVSSMSLFITAWPRLYGPCKGLLQHNAQ